MLLALFPTIGLLCGWALDRMLNTKPWLTITLLVLGFVAGAREVWKSVKPPESHDQ